MTPTIFLGFVAFTAAVVVALCAFYLGRRTALAVALGLSAWFVYVGLVAHTGVLRDATRRPPGILFVVLPVAAFFVIAVRRSAGGGVATAFPLWLLLAAQVFRVGVELFLHRLWIEGLVPKTLTFGGANVDIYVGASAPLVAWLSTRRAGPRIALSWTVLGLLALANVVTRAVLTAPGPLNLIHAEVPNRMFSTFPYVLIPGFFVPLAVMLHVLALRSIGRRLSRGPAPVDFPLAAAAPGR